MPRFYNDRMRPSTNKAATPGQEKKGGTPPAPPKNDGKKGEGGEK